ncbi:MAG: D-alanyl-D-alanine endopeptidase [Rhodoferax sp.]|nr:D-alanyl-D-alanine endopeptidase [Rhodoferax sp.]MDR3369433.1 D-alanyl-D-alanine endopeptidase [Rhodoferax sp.]
MALAPLSISHAATTSKARVAKHHVAKVQVEKSKKVAVQGRRRVTAVISKKYVRSTPRVVVPEIASVGQMEGLHTTSDALNLKSSVALVVDQQTNEVLYSKNDKAVLPIASLTKLMTGLLIGESHLPMDESITITSDDVDTEKHSSSRLQVGSVLTRGELLHLALMSSENRAAHALARTSQGGLTTFVAQMNAKARSLGMVDTIYVEPTGLSSSNRSSARDLVKLVDVAHQHPLLRELTTSPGFEVDVGRRTLQFNNTNRLVKNPTWDIGLQKTGYISEAGRCLVMQASIAGRNFIMVFLDSAGKLTRFADAERVRHWIQTTEPGVSAKVAVPAING